MSRSVCAPRVIYDYQTTRVHTGRELVQGTLLSTVGISGTGSHRRPCPGSVTGDYLSQDGVDVGGAETCGRDLVSPGPELW